MRLNAVQTWLESIYGLHLEHKVEDFLVTDPKIARELDGSPNPRDIREKLLVSQSDDEVGIALYLDAGIVSTLESAWARGELWLESLAEFLLALEGVSHFVCLVWNAGRERGVSLLELEMQAEIDKFVLTALLLAGLPGRFEPSGLRRWLFDAPLFDPALEETQKVRYEEANRFAGKYCHYLERRHWRGDTRTPGRPLFGELRRFYRLSQADKISLIHHRYA
jgi:hypothetical protein